jgi:hypothetical protein
VPLDLLYLPGLFGAGAERLLGRLIAGIGSWRVRSLRAPGAPAGGAADVGAWLAATDSGECRVASLELGAAEGGSWSGKLEVAGTPIPGRQLVAISLFLPAGRPLGAMRALELGLLGIACAALAGEDQGAVLIGADLGSAAASRGPGTVSEQLRRILGDQGDRLQVVVCTADTAASLGPLEGFVDGSLGDLREFRRGAPPR